MYGMPYQIDIFPLNNKKKPLYQAAFVVLTAKKIFIERLTASWKNPPLGEKAPRLQSGG